MNEYQITTAKGSHAGTLIACLAWQAEYQGALADIIHPDGRACRIHGPGADLDIGVADENDPYREDGDLTPDEAADRVEAWFRGHNAVATDSQGPGPRYQEREMYRAIIVWHSQQEGQIVCESDLPETEAIAECQQALSDRLYSTGTQDYHWAGVQRQSGGEWIDCALYSFGQGP